MIFGCFSFPFFSHSGPAVVKFLTPATFSLFGFFHLSQLSFALFESEFAPLPYYIVSISMTTQSCYRYVIILTPSPKYFSLSTRTNKRTQHSNKGNDRSFRPSPWSCNYMDSIFRETDTEIKRDGDVFYFDCLNWFCYCGSSFL